MKIRNKKFPEGTLSVGSALILAVVLTSLLAIVGVLFLMVARVDKIATSAISENRELNWAVETVVAKISQELVSDVPGTPNPIDPDLKAEYYDYPDAKNPWLASLEPKVDNNGTPADISDDIYYWPHLTDLYSELDANAWGLQAEIIPDYQYDVNEDLPADADGDGVADSRWIELEHITSSEGKPIFAAVRIIDNGGMLNVNTAYKFDPCELLPYEILRKRIDGSSQMQINLMALAHRPPDPYTLEDEGSLLLARVNNDPCLAFALRADPDSYEKGVVWRITDPCELYTPFDISDELEIRNRFLLNHTDIDTRLEAWGGEFRRDTELSTPVDSGGIELDRWFYRSQHEVPGPNDIYSYRHIATTYNMDRIIDADGGKMVNVNRINPVAEPNVSDLYGAIWRGLYDASIDNNSLTAQIAANIKDFADNDSNVTTVYDLYGNPHYGFEQPCVYISELAHKFVLVDPNDPNTAYRSYAIELYKPYFEDNDPCDWQLVINNPPRAIDVDWSGTEQFDVRYWEDANKIAMLVVDFNDSNCCDPCDPDCDPCDCDTAKAGMYVNPIDREIFAGGSVIELQRFVADVNYHIVVDSVVVPVANATTGWLIVDGNAHSIQRDISLHKCIRRLWGPNSLPPSLGHSNSYPPYPDPDPRMIQAHPANSVTNIGEIGMVFTKSAYTQGPNPIGPSDTEATARLNLANPNFQQIFNYLTVFDPAVHGQGVNETRIKGRININTAPWYVIAQLPWVSQRYGYNSGALAQAIVAYRDRTFVPGGPDYRGRPGEPGFGSIGELNRVVDPLLNPDYSIDYYKWVAADQAGPPDLTPEDGAVNDFEERDLIFARISNLVTVRSDVFTAYILVRIGVDGPQKRAVAILDRSNVYSVDGKVKIVALHPVPDPR